MVKNGFSNVVDAWWLVVSKVYSITVILGRRLSPQKYKVLTTFTVNISFNIHGFCGGYIKINIFVFPTNTHTTPLYGFVLISH